MDEDRAEGTARKAGGNVQEGLGNAMGDSETKAKGQINQASGAAQDMYGQAKDWLRQKVETQPYTAVLAAVGIGWLLGRLHRPL